MNARAFGLLMLCWLLAGTVAGAGATNFEALRSRFPRGIPWRVEILDASGKSLGVLEVLVTSQPAKSCLKDFGPGYLVSYSRHPEDLDSWKLGSFGVASVSGNVITLDLTGGRCSDYVVAKGEVTTDGTSAGEVFTLHKMFGHDLGTYRATLL
jgi:hypothetical protein